jgi:hypothetical protein
MGRLTWFLAGGVALLATATAVCSGFAVFGLARFALVAAILLAALGYYRRVENFRLCLSALLATVVFSSSFVVLTYVAARCAPPLIDAWLVRWDGGLGFSSLRAWHYGWFGIALSVAYYSLLPQTAATVAVLGLANQREPLERFLQRMMVAGLITLTFFLVAPAIGPCAAHPAPDQTAYIEQFLALRNGSRTAVNLADAEGLITFPSFHTVWALLLVAACPRRFKALSIVLNAAVLLATLTTGWHYLSDVLGGIAVYYAACAIVTGQAGVAIQSSTDVRTFIRRLRNAPQSKS